MDILFKIRSRVHALLEKGRMDGVVKSSLSADVAIGISSANTPDIIDLLGREGMGHRCFRSFRLTCTS